MKKTMTLLLAFLALAGRADDHVYQGHYASGISKWTVKGAHVYQGHYASGISKWTTAASSGLLHVYEGHYASGISKWTYKDGHLYEGHYASGLSKWTYKDGHIYQGHYASGISKFTFKNNHLYRGHYASGISAWTFGSTAEVPDGLLVFLATQVLEPGGTEAGAVSGASPAPGTVIGGSATTNSTVVTRTDGTGSRDVVATETVTSQTLTVAPSASGGSGPGPGAGAAAAPHPACWDKARVLRGVYEEGGRIVAAVEVKCGKADRRGESRVSATVTPFTGRAVRFRAQKCRVDERGAAGAWGGQGLVLAVGDADFAGTFGAGVVRSAAVGGELPAGGHRFRTVAEGGAEGLDAGLLPLDVPFVSSGRRWTFDRAHPSRLRATYAPAKGVFRGSFKAAYPQAGRVRAVTVKFTGLVADGAGVGAAASRRPAQTYSVSVE